MMGQSRGTWARGRDERAGDPPDLPDSQGRGSSIIAQANDRGQSVRVFEGSVESGRPDAGASVWNESAPERSIVQTETIEGRDWKCRLGTVGKGWSVSN